MTTLRDGTVVDESITAVNYTPAHLCKAVFGYDRIIKSITIHHWGNHGQDFDDVTGYLASANARQSSAHATIMAKRVASIVNPDDASWHAGNPYGSATSIGLELRPEATPEDYVTAAAYIAFLRGIYGDLPLIPHRDWTNTFCPGKWDLALLDLMARDISTEPMQELQNIEEDEMVTITLMNDGTGTIWATADFVTKWRVPNPDWLAHYRNIEAAGLIKLRRQGNGVDIWDIPAFGAEASDTPGTINLPADYIEKMGDRLGEELERAKQDFELVLKPVTE